MKYLPGLVSLNLTSQHILVIVVSIIFGSTAVVASKKERSSACEQN